ncbi:CDP-glucose 4,6-dehydratase [Brucepastera parasyntrophica]|uniref:CDP-glucose 4,6-dehydratase n=1 Tax=Brucepastera parasyntrophica TaxID=2880008 RepID=UPI002109C20A|nr:CDP-glucose 4,6-dehydratase [Brucepastera parasyntrophica]ULQ59875.1 CDP-glucose 4,6-dehydratase [Brucepastera parasyntrophica]
MIDLSFYKGKKVFITGHTGFKGAWLCRILLMSGADICGYALEPTKSSSLFTLTGIEKHMNSVIGDIRNQDSLRKTIRNFQPEVLFHLAAQPLVRLSYQEPVLTYETNIMGTVNVLEVLRDIPCIRSFINVTTDKVYENKEWCWGYRENETLCGYDPYSNSKSCSELVTSSYRNSFFMYDGAPAISTARSGNVIGGGDYSDDRIIPDCIRAVSSGNQIIVRNPFSIRPYQHVLECLYGYLLLAKKQYEDINLAGSYNFGPHDESCISTGQLADLFCSIWGNETSWVALDNEGPHEANFLKLDCAKARTALGWNPVWNIKRAVEKVVEWNKTVMQNNPAEEITDKQIAEYFSFCKQIN